MSPESLGLVHRFVPGESSRTLLLLHGTGGNERDLIPLGRSLDPEAALLSPRGQVLEHGMPRFFRRLAEGVFDIDDLVYRSRELASFIRDAAEAYGFDAGQLTAAGFSNGANIAAAILLLHPGVLRSAVLFRAMVPLEPETRPDLRGTAVFLAAGRSDPMVPAAGTERLAALLRDGGATVTLTWQPGGHALTQDDVEEARRWMTRRLETTTVTASPSPSDT